MREMGLQASRSTILVSLSKDFITQTLVLMEERGIDTGDVAHTLDTNNPVTVAAWHPYKYWIAYAGDPGGLKLFGPSST